MNDLRADVLVVGGGVGGTVAAIQAARRGAKTILVSEFGWLGGMLTAAGVSAPDGNELAAFQTGMWSTFLRQLQQRQSQGLEHSWVSFFTYDPRVGADIFAAWVKELPNLQWIRGQVPLEVLQQDNRVVGVRFPDYQIEATIVLDGTELGDVLALAEVPHRWGWEWQAEWSEPSAPVQANELTQQYPIQSPTWVVVLQDLGDAEAPEILAPSIDHPQQFGETWTGYGAEQFLNYGRLPENRFMINWPQQGNDYGVRLDRLIQSPAIREEFLQEAYWHTQSYARYLQLQLKDELGRQIGLATDIFPVQAGRLGGGAFALHPYFRESRRLRGLVTVREQDILPVQAGQVAALPMNELGQVESIALGNYANDHHYPGYQFSLAPKSIRWGGRWTGTPFTLPYRCLIPAEIDGLLVCEKNISVSHIANGATRLQPVVMGIGQAAGMAAALCIEQNCQPRDLPVTLLQTALLEDPIAPVALIPLFNLLPDHPDWMQWQRYYLQHPDCYPIDGNCPIDVVPVKPVGTDSVGQKLEGVFYCRGEQDYEFEVTQPIDLKGTIFKLVTLAPLVNQRLQRLVEGQTVQVRGVVNRSGSWIRVEAVG